MNKLQVLVQTLIKTRSFVIVGAILAFLFPNYSISQSLNLGFPTIINFADDEYKAGHQNWDVLWLDGRTYFANNAGLVAFSGNNWQTHTTPNNTVLRSLASCGKDTVFVGGQGEIGFFTPDDTGHMRYHSLLEAGIEEVNEVWDMIYHKNKLYLTSKYNEIIEYENGQAKIYEQGGYIRELSLIRDEIWFFDASAGIFRITEGETQLLEGTESLKGAKVSKIIERDSVIFIFTEKEGIYTYAEQALTPWNTNIDSFLKEKLIKKVLLDQNGHFLVGTYLGGLITISKDGTALKHIHNKNGLQNNHISSMALSPGNELWLGTQNGIDKVLLNQNSATFYPDGELEGSIYDIERWEGKLFFCTSHGLYYIEDKPYYNPLGKHAFKLVTGSEGQVWGLDVINGELFMAHHKGGFLIDKQLNLRQLIGDQGAWQFLALDDNTIAAGLYNGVVLLQKKEGRWSKAYEVPGLYESCRVMALDEYNNLWISHPYKSIYKLNFDSSYTSCSIKEYGENQGLKTNNRNYVFPLLNNIVVTNELGVFSYDYKEDRFKAHEKLGALFPYGIHLRRIINKNNEVWTISEYGTEQLIIKEKDGERLFSKKHIGSKSYNAEYMGGFENLYPLSDGYFMQCTDSGVKIIGVENIPSQLNAPLINAASLPSKGDSILFGGYGQPKHFELSKDTKAIHFECASENEEKFGHYFMYMLEGQDEGWSEWTNSTIKEYTNLASGNYTFMAKMVNIHNQESPPQSLSFSIKTPWYKTALAYLLYTCLILIGLLTILIIPRRQYMANTAQLLSEKEASEAMIIQVQEATEAEMLKVKAEKDKELEIIKRQAEIEKARLEKEKLENEIAFKNKELAMSTMNLLQKNETLTAIRTEVEKIEKNIKDTQAKKEVKKIISLLRTDDRLEDEWNNFSIHFDQAHHQFLKRLKASYPQLTPKDQKLCAYLRMNLSTKEIAPLLKISVRGVEISRYRLRKKLELEKDVNLNDFMMAF